MLSKIIRQNQSEVETALIAQCAQGDRKAQYELYQQYSQAMFNICLRMLNAVEDAEDALQEAFISAFRNIGQFKGQSTFGAWLKRIVINQCLNQLRSKKDNRLSLEEVPIGDWAEQDMGELPKLSVAAVREAIQDLPDGFRVVLSLYLLEGYDHQEIASILGISASTSKSQYSRAKAKLRELLRGNLMQEV